MLFSAFEQNRLPAVVYSDPQRSSIFSACPVWNTQNNISQNIERLCSNHNRKKSLSNYIYFQLYVLD